MGSFGKGDHLLLVDGSGYIFRAYFSSLNVGSDGFRFRSDGTPVGALHIFCQMVITDVLMSTRKPSHIAVVFDYSARSYRTEIYPAYKANRPPPPEDLIPQFASIREATKAFNIACLELEGYEADDIIATLAVRAQKAGGEVTIISSDKDLMQLVGDGITMYDTRKKEVIGREQVQQKFNVSPEQVVDVQTLMGDSTDNIPGVPSVGPKTAANLINEFGSLDNLVARLDEIKRPKLRDAIKDNVDLLPVFRQLVELHRDVPLSSTLDDLLIQDPEPQPLFEFLMEQEFRALVRRAAEYLNVDPPAQVLKDAGIKSRGGGVGAESLPFKPEEYGCLATPDSIRALKEKIYERGRVALALEVDDDDESRAEVVGIGFAVSPQEACWLPMTNSPLMDELFGQGHDNPQQVSSTEAMEILKPMFEDPSILKIGQNIKLLAKVLLRTGIELHSIDDIQLMTFVIGEGNHKFELNRLAEEQLGYKPLDRKDVLKDGDGKKIAVTQLPVSQATALAATNADIILRLWLLSLPQLSRKQVTRVYDTLEKPLISVLAKAEDRGILVDPGFLQRLSSEFGQELQSLEGQIYEEAGEKFNIASPKQLGIILFEKNELPIGKAKTPRGYKTSVDILEELAEKYKLPQLILDWRHLAKLKSTYTDSLQKNIHPETGRVHTTYRLDGANTGRLASINPNLQNIPIRTSIGRRIREAFVAKDGHMLVSLDYSQIELRILAYMANVKGMRQAFKDNLDIHLATASEMFSVPLDEVGSDLRRKAKAINFGIIYGISAFGLARNLQIERSEASQFIKGYFERYPEIRQYMNDIVEVAKAEKHVKTLFGRKIGTPKIDSKGPLEAFARRAAINAPIQGSAADVIRRAMVRVPEAIAKLPADLLLQIHDELLFEVREDAVPDLITAATKVMEGADRPAVEIQPRLVVDSGVGKNWSEAH